jgi:hypothetical protein
MKTLAPPDSICRANAICPFVLETSAPAGVAADVVKAAATNGLSSQINRDFGICPPFFDFQRPIRLSHTALRRRPALSAGFASTPIERLPR